MKICNKCKITKPFTAFSKDKHTRTGYKIYCKACSSVVYTSWRTQNLEKVRRKDRVNHYVRTYGLDENVAEALVDNRTGTCEICANEDLLVVDHCHVSGRVRGFICSACNTMLGRARDNATTLRKAALYLEKYRE